MGDPGGEWVHWLDLLGSQEPVARKGRRLVPAQKSQRRQRPLLALVLELELVRVPRELALVRELVLELMLMLVQVLASVLDIAQVQVQTQVQM